MQKIKIAQIGAFDVENFGDLLFPEVLKLKLGSEYDIDLFSPVGGIKPFDAQVIYPINKLEAKIIQNKYQAIIIGGGDLIRTDCKIYIKNDIYGYTVDPSLELWAYPIILANKYDIPVILNSVGVTNDFSDSEKFIVQELLNKVDYLSVRDSEANNALKKSGIFSAAIVPDTVLTIKDVYSDKDLDACYNKLLVSKSIPDINDYVIFQHNSTNIENESYYQDILNLLKEIAKNHKILLMPIGYIHDDDKTLQKIAKEKISNIYSMSENVKLTPKEMVSIIKHSIGYVGTSMHGAVVSYAFEKKIMILNSMNSKKLHGFANIVNKSILDVNNSSVLSYIYNHYYEDQETTYNVEISKKINHQFDIFKNIIKNGSKKNNKKISAEELIRKFYANSYNEQLIGEYYNDKDGYLKREIFKYEKSKDGYYTFKNESDYHNIKLKPIINKFCTINKLIVNKKEYPFTELNDEINIEITNNKLEIKVQVSIMHEKELYNLMKKVNEQYKNSKIKLKKLVKNYDNLLKEYKKVEQKYCDTIRKKGE